MTPVNPIQSQEEYEQAVKQLETLKRDQNSAEYRELNGRLEAWRGSNPDADKNRQNNPNQPSQPGQLGQPNQNQPNQPNRSR